MKLVFKKCVRVCVRACVCVCVCGQASVSDRRCHGDVSCRHGNQSCRRRQTVARQRDVTWWRQSEGAAVREFAVAVEKVFGPIGRGLITHLCLCVCEAGWLFGWETGVCLHLLNALNNQSSQAIWLTAVVHCFLSVSASEMTRTVFGVSLFGAYCFWCGIVRCVIVWCILFWCGIVRCVIVWCILFLVRHCKVGIVKCICVCDVACACVHCVVVVDRSWRVAPCFVCCNYCVSRPNEGPPSRQQTHSTPGTSPLHTTASYTHTLSQRNVLFWYFELPAKNWINFSNFRYAKSSGNLTSEHCKLAHFTRKMSPHYLVKRKSSCLQCITVNIIVWMSNYTGT